MSPPTVTVDILSDSDSDLRRGRNRIDAIDLSTPSAVPLKKQKTELHSNPTVFVIDDDDYTPAKPHVGPTTSASTPSFVPDTPLSDLSKPDASIVKCSYFSSGHDLGPSMVEETPVDENSRFDFSVDVCKKGVEGSRDLSSLIVNDNKCSGTTGLICLDSDNDSEGGSEDTMHGSVSGSQPTSFRYDDSLDHHYPCEEAYISEPFEKVLKPKSKSTDDSIRNNKDEENAKKRISKEERLRLKEEKKQQREQEKMLKAAQKAAQKAEAAEMKKLQKEKQKWEKGKFALKSIVALIDTKVVELGSIGGHLITRLAEKGLSYRITSNPIEKSILWTMGVPESVSPVACEPIDVRYVLLVYEAEEFCKLVLNGSLLDHASNVRRIFPLHKLCYITNRLMAYINKREQSQYKDPTMNAGWKRPPIEEVLAKLTTQFVGVHLRQCIDEAEVADHIVGLTSNLASCQYRNKLSRLSVNANGTVVLKDCVERDLIKKSPWLKALVAIPKVQPRFAIAIWKKYPTMKSLLSVYMDPNKSVHEKEFLLSDLILEGLLGDTRRLGEMCSKRVYRILMAQSGGIKTDDIECGADFFTHRSV